MNWAVLAFIGRKSGSPEPQQQNAKLEPLAVQPSRKPRNSQKGQLTCVTGQTREPIRKDHPPQTPQGSQPRIRDYQIAFHGAGWNTMVGLG